ncbi:MAG: RNA polymerase sigma factor [Bradymonadaceae bacterium]
MTANAAVPCTERQNADDETLIQRSLEGDRDAFDTLMCRHSDKLFRLARSIVDDEADAHDVLQRAMVKIHRKLDTLRDASSFNSWAYRIVRNMALMHIRKQDRNDEIGFGQLGAGRDDERHFESLAPQWRSNADEAAETSELRERLLSAIEDLEPKYQSPFVLYEFDGHDIHEIADLLDLSNGGVKSRLHRARKKLRATLERYVRQDLNNLDDTA